MLLDREARGIEEGRSGLQRFHGVGANRAKLEGAGLQKAGRHQPVVVALIFIDPPTEIDWFGSMVPRSRRSQPSGPGVRTSTREATWCRVVSRR